MPYQHLPQISAAESVEQFASALGALCRAANAEHFLAVRLRGTQLDNVAQVIHNAPAPELVDGLKHWSLSRLIDAMRRSPLPIVFGDGAMPAPEVPGFSSGVACMAREPRGAVVIVLGLSSLELAPARQLPLVQPALMAAHHSIAALSRLHAAACPLSDRELECLQLAFGGELSSREIGQRLGISARTAEHYLEQARAKLGAESTLAAGVRAVDQGWMDLLSRGPIQVAN